MTTIQGPIPAIALASQAQGQSVGSCSTCAPDSTDVHAFVDASIEKYEADIARYRALIEEGERVIEKLSTEKRKADETLWRYKSDYTALKDELFRRNQNIWIYDDVRKVAGGLSLVASLSAFSGHPIGIGVFLVSAAVATVSQCVFKKQEKRCDHLREQMCDTDMEAVDADMQSRLAEGEIRCRQTAIHASEQAIRNAQGPLQVLKMATSPSPSAGAIEVSPQKVNIGGVVVKRNTATDAIPEPNAGSL